MNLAALIDIDKWQVISRKLADRRNSTKIVAVPSSLVLRVFFCSNYVSIQVDLQEMAPIEGVIQLQVRKLGSLGVFYLTFLQGDITSPATAEKIVSLFDGEKAGTQTHDSLICRL